MTDRSANLRKRCDSAADADRTDRRAEVDNVIDLADALIAADDEVPAQKAQARKEKAERDREAQRAAAKEAIQTANAFLLVAALLAGILAVTVLLTATGFSRCGCIPLLVAAVALLYVTATDEPTPEGTQQPSPPRRKTLAGFAATASFVFAATCWGWLGGWFAGAPLLLVTLPSTFLLLTELDAGKDPNEKGAPTSSQTIR